MKISIVTVVYNDKQGLLKTYESLSSQVFTNYEWVVVDGGSTDGAIEFLHSINNMSLVWESEPDKGIYDAMNKGIAMSSGEYLVFMNAGDEFYNKYTLDSVISSISKSDSPVDIVFGGAEYCFKNNISLYRPPKEIGKYIWHGLPANHQATYYKKTSIIEPAYDLKYLMCGDYYIVSSMYKSGVHALYINKPIVRFDMGGVSSRRPFLLIKEAYQVQRDVLKISIFFRLVSLFRRSIAMIIVKITSIIPRRFFNMSFLVR